MPGYMNLHVCCNTTSQYLTHTLYFRYDAFDFHKECSKMKWHRLSLLTDRLSPKQREFGSVAQAHITVRCPVSHDPGIFLLVTGAHVCIH